MPDSEWVERASKSLREETEGRVEVGYPIAKFTSFRLGGPAAVYFEAASEADLVRAGSVAADMELNVLVLGRGTNVLVSDRGFDGLVLRLGKGFDWVRSYENTIESGALTPVPQVANRAAKLGLTGLEFAIAIPATVGGAVRMNAGAHGKSISDALDSCRVYRVGEPEARVWTTAELDMQYRETSLDFRDVVCAASFKLEPGARDEIAKLMESYRAHRSETQPIDGPNAGSMFRNPPGDSAGRLIEAAGMKGFRVGGAEVSIKHANFFLASPGASSQDVFDLMVEVQRVVREQFGAVLIPEVWTIGAFEGQDALVTH